MDDAERATPDRRLGLGEATLGSELSASVAGVMAEFYGRGPSRARTYVLDRLVFCVLEEPFTTAELGLIEAGEQDLVREARLIFQDIMGTTFVTNVEKLTARRVVGYHSQVVFDPPRALEWFLLDPEMPAPSGRPGVAANLDDAEPGRPGDADAATGAASAFAAHVQESGGEGRTRSAVANAANRIVTESTGRGATASRAYVVDDGVLCILDGAPTTVERTLAAGERADLARRLRRAVTATARERLLDEIGTIVGRRLVAVEAQLVFSPDALLLALLADPGDR